MHRFIFAVFVTFSLSAPSVFAAHVVYSDADFQGDYALTLSENSPSNDGDGLSHFYTGVLTADGRGNISGVRTLSYSPGIFPQTITGTYSVNPDGTGQANVVALPPGHMPLTGRETWEFVLGPPGVVFLSGLLESRTTRSGAVTGTLVRQEPAIDLTSILVRLEELDAKLCETIRLLNTPEGLRSSECCDESLDFPNGKDAPTCGPTQPSPLPAPLQGESLPARERLERR